MEMWDYRLSQKARARRTRKNLVKAKAKAYRIAQVFYSFPFLNDTWEDIIQLRNYIVISYYRNRKPCSCWMCGNLRQTWGATTRQELLANIDYKQQMDDLDII